jgi:hypothetical protein
MIAKIVPAPKDARGAGALVQYIAAIKQGERTTAAERLTAYVVDEAGAGEKVAWVRVSNCGSEDPAIAAREIVAVQGKNTRAKDLTLHLIVSFPPGERPEDKVIRAIEDDLLETLGMDEHQRVSALHWNTEHVHLHIAINRVHPETLRAVAPFQSHRRLMVACERLELAHGLTRTNHGLDEAERDPTKPQGKAADFEARERRESFQRWACETLAPALIAARDGGGGWQAIHDAAASHGVVVKPRGAGLAIVDATREGLAIKASDIDRSLSMGRLTEALGAFVPSVNEQARETVSAYEGRPLQPHPGVPALWQDYSRQRETAKEEREARLKSLRQAAEAERAEIDSVHRQNCDWLTQRSVRIITSHLGEKLRELRSARRGAVAASREAERRMRDEIRKTSRVPSWQEWLEQRAGQGDDAALAALRSLEQRRVAMAAGIEAATTASDAANQALSGHRTKLLKDGRLMYRLDDGGIVVDDHRLIRVTTESKAAAVVATSLAAERFQGQKLRVTGTESFRSEVARHVARSGIEVQFDQPEMSALVKLLRAANPPDMGPSMTPLVGRARFLGERADNGNAVLVWQQGETEIAEPATEAARLGAANLMPGDLVDRLDDGRMIVLERGGDLEAGL